jgi:hypothetical protein
MQTTNHKIRIRSRGSPPLLQSLHRRVRLPSVFDQNHGVADPAYERGIKPSATTPFVVVAINQRFLTIVSFLCVQLILPDITSTLKSNIQTSSETQKLRADIL